MHAKTAWRGWTLCTVFDYFKYKYQSESCFRNLKDYHIFGNLILVISLINEISVLSPCKNSKVYDITKDMWFNKTMLRNIRHVTTKYIWRHKNESSNMFDIVVNIWYKSFKKYSRSNYFFVDLKNIAIQPYFCSETP